MDKQRHCQHWAYKTPDDENRERERERERVQIKSHLNEEN